MQAVILTGIFAGFVHVVSGADHLIAMAPAAINNPQKALKNSFMGLRTLFRYPLLSFPSDFHKGYYAIKQIFQYSRIPSWNFSSNCWSICNKKFF